MDELDADVPLLRGKPVSVGITYNLKKGTNHATLDAEAEYDSMDTVLAIRAALEKAGAKVSLFEADASLPEKLAADPVDVVFNIAEGIRGRGREAQIPALLNMLGIPFTGSDETTLCIALDKALTKRLLTTYHIRTPRSAVISASGTAHAGALRYPVIVKPNAEGSSKGISDVCIVESAEELRKLAKENIALYGEDMLAEEFVTGREFTVGLIGNGNGVRVFSPMEVVYDRDTQGGYRVYSYNVKQNYTEFVHYECPAKLTEAEEREMVKLARRIYSALGCRDFARIDFRMDAAGEIHFIEINPLPGLAPHYSDYPMLAEFCGVEYDALIAAILKAALLRIGLA